MFDKNSEINKNAENYNQSSFTNESNTETIYDLYNPYKNNDVIHDPYTYGLYEGHLPWTERYKRRRNKNLIKNPLYNVANILNYHNYLNTKNKENVDNILENNIISSSKTFSKEKSSTPSFNPRILPRLKSTTEYVKTNNYYPDNSSRAPSEENVSLLAAGNGILEISPDKAGLVEEFSDFGKKDPLFPNKERSIDKKKKGSNVFD